MDFPIGEDMDGHVLFDAISPIYLQSNPIKKIKSYDFEQYEEQVDENITIEKEVKEKLKSLGYI